MKSKEQNKNKQNIIRFIDAENRLMLDREEVVAGLVENWEGIKRHKLAVTEQSREGKVQHREHSQ